MPELPHKPLAEYRHEDSEVLKWMMQSNSELATLEEAHSEYDRIRAKKIGVIVFDPATGKTHGALFKPAAPEAEAYDPSKDPFKDPEWCDTIRNLACEEYLIPKKTFRAYEKDEESEEFYEFWEGCERKFLKKHKNLQLSDFNDEEWREALIGDCLISHHVDKCSYTGDAYLNIGGASAIERLKDNHNPKSTPLNTDVKKTAESALAATTNPLPAEVAISAPLAPDPAPKPKPHSWPDVLGSVILPSLIFKGMGRSSRPEFINRAAEFKNHFPDTDLGFRTAEELVDHWLGKGCIKIPPVPSYIPSKLRYDDKRNDW